MPIVESGEVILTFGVSLTLFFFHTLDFTRHGRPSSIGKVRLFHGNKSAEYRLIIFRSNLGICSVGRREVRD